MKGKALGLSVAVGVALLAGVQTASAHHAFAAAFDADALVTVQGVLTDVKLVNPHSWFYVDVTDAKGNVEHWQFEGQTPTGLMRSGLRPNFVKAGDKVTIKGCRARDLTKTIGAARELVLADGRSFIVGPKNSSEQDQLTSSGGL
jgi:hypothetical protein